MNKIDFNDLAICEESVDNSEGMICFDTAGVFGFFCGLSCIGVFCIPSTI